MKNVKEEVSQEDQWKLESEDCWNNNKVKQEATDHASDGEMTVKDSFEPSVKAEVKDEASDIGYATDPGAVKEELTTDLGPQKIRRSILCAKRQRPNDLNEPSFCRSSEPMPPSAQK